MQNADITFFGQTSFRGKHVKFGIKRDDKRRHIYIIGKTGMGKTELLKNMITQDIKKGNGICFVDPHGDAAEELLQFIPEDRVKDVVYFNPADLDNPIAFNIMEDVSAEYRHLIAGGIMAVFKKIWPDVWSSRMEYILNNCILALLEVPGSTLLGINKMLSNPEWRETIVNQVKDPIIKAFWTKEFARYSQRYETEATAAIQNKIGQFISAPLIRNIIGQPNSALDMRDIMDNKKIFIVNLSKGRVGEESSRLLGALLITKLQLAAMSRVDTPEDQRNDFILYIDEFQNFSTDSFASILSEARKYRLSLVLAHQYIAQMEEKVRDAVFGNVGTMIVFRVGADDAEFLEREFSPEFYIEDIVNLPKQNIYLKLMIDGVSSRPFSASTLPPVKMEGESVDKQIIDYSRMQYSTDREVVEEKIAKDTEDDASPTGGTPAVKDSFGRTSELYDTICQSCDKKMKVPFKPDGKRPVYCKTCLKKMEQDPSLRNVRRVNDSDKPKEYERPKEVPPIKSFSQKTATPPPETRIEKKDIVNNTPKAVETPKINNDFKVKPPERAEVESPKKEEAIPSFKKEIRSNYIGPAKEEEVSDDQEEMIKRIRERLLKKGIDIRENLEPESVLTNHEKEVPKSFEKPEAYIKEEAIYTETISTPAQVDEVVPVSIISKKNNNLSNYISRKEGNVEEVQEIEKDKPSVFNSPVSKDIPEKKEVDTFISLEESAKKFVPEEKEKKEFIDIPEHKKVPDKPLETKSGKKIDFEGLMDIIKRETGSNEDKAGKLNPGDKVKFD
ncbi:MAG: hypothetical protein MNSN_09160 [Minisyncoccus archaeiphilus]|uniref:type IV secretion system DNA-binding domain-containing protein n=1 Tax=Minisyncoccus archaeiphilus TaxID=3238481 RepID=UPI002B095079|nr:MAG: hypothetical protein MNSN_09160 [Candidatus Parcubacteria bacterium]